MLQYSNHCVKLVGDFSPKFRKEYLSEMERSLNPFGTAEEHKAELEAMNNDGSWVVEEYVIKPDREIKRFLVHTNDGRVELNLDFVGMLENYCVWGQINSKHISESFDKATDAYNRYNFYFIDAKTEAATLLIKATGVHA
jgi:hypothetical protein